MARKKRTTRKGYKAKNLEYPIALENKLKRIAGKEKRNLTEQIIYVLEQFIENAQAA